MPSFETAVQWFCPITGPYLAPDHSGTGNDQPGIGLPKEILLSKEALSCVAPDAMLPSRSARRNDHAYGQKSRDLNRYFLTRPRIPIVPT